MNEKTTKGYRGAALATLKDFRVGIWSDIRISTEVPYVNLGWAMGHTHDRRKAAEMMLTPIAGEITCRESFNGYLIMQGGLPEMDKLLKEVHV